MLGKNLTIYLTMIDFVMPCDDGKTLAMRLIFPERLWNMRISSGQVSDYQDYENAYVTGN